MRLPLTILKKEDFNDAPSWLDKLLRPIDTQFRALSQILNGGILLGDNVQGFTKSVTVTLKDPWVPLTLSSGWVTVGASYADPAYRFAGDELQLRGVAKPGTASSPLATLPVSPTTSQSFIAPCTASGAVSFTRVDVNTNGTVQLASPPASITWLSLQGIRFQVPSAAYTQTPNAAFPVKFKNDLPGQRKPSLVLLCSVTDTTGSTATPVSCSVPAWSTSGDQIVVSDVAGLISNRRYQLVFFVT